MEHAEIHIGGLDLRTPDRDAPAGTARRLQNLYPSGAPEKPVWRPVKNRTLYLDDTGYSIISLHVWYRSNFPTTLVFLAVDDSTQQLKLYGREMNANGVFIGLKSTLHDFVVEYAGHTSNFAQIGDNLIVNLVHNEECDDIIVIRMINGVLTSLPYNLPELPQITSPENSLIAVGTRDHEKRDEKTMCFGFQYGYKLKDGSITRLSNIVIRTSSADEFLIPVQTDTGIERRQSGGATSATRDDGATRDLAPKIEYESKGFVYFNGARVTSGKHTVSVNAPILDSLYKELIDSIVVFISQPKATTIEVLSDAMFYEYGEIKDIFGTGTKELKVQFTLEKLLINPILEADNLLQHGIYPVVLDSYNKMLLMGDVAIDYVLPKIEGIIELQAPTMALEPFNIGIVGSGAFFNLQWSVNQPELLASSTVDITNWLNEPDWTSVFVDQKTRSIPFSISDFGKSVRIKCKYSDGSESDYAYFTIPAVAVNGVREVGRGELLGLETIMFEYDAPQLPNYWQTIIEFQALGANQWDWVCIGNKTAGGIIETFEVVAANGTLRLQSQGDNGYAGAYVYYTITI